MIKLNKEKDINKHISNISSKMVLTLEYKGKTYKDVRCFDKMLSKIIENSKYPKELLRDCMCVELDQSLARCILFAVYDEK